MPQSGKQKILIIVGTTASGKSALAVELAKKFNGEVISADSRQVYRKLDIGTAKITQAQMQDVPHHLIDIVNIDETYTAADFKRDAQIAINDITARGMLPVITGGTFFYIDVLLERTSTPEVPPNEALRAELESLSIEALNERLAQLDKRRAADIDTKNKRRLIRSIEIAQTLGSVPEHEEKESPYDLLVLGIVADKDELRTKLKERAEAWLQNGFIEEVQGLLETGVSKSRLLEMGFEYQLGMELAEGTLTKDSFVQKFIEKNWQYAKRQLTWLKRDQSVHWIYLSEKLEIDMLIEQFLLN